jgi:hypothetical protein
MSSATVTESTNALLAKAYREFNARNMEAVIALMQPDVEWPNGMEGGTVHGHDGVRQYWTRQWAMLNPQVTPVGFDVDAAGRTVVNVRQIVRNLDGGLLLDREVKHVYTMENGLIRSMEIYE